MFRCLLPLALLVLVGCAGSGPDLVGSWRLVESGPGRPPAEEAVKILNDTHFAFGSDQSGGVFAGGGLWRLEGETYLEEVQWHSRGDLVGETIRFGCRVVDGRWHHTADFEVNDRRYHIEEIWERIDID